jgi:type II secretory pathway pseudopilin PulG
MMIVLAVLAILATIAIPKFGGSISRNRLDAAARRVRIDLDGARDLARRTSQSVRVRFSAGSHAYVYDGVASVDRPAETYRIELAREPYCAAIDAVDFGGDGDVVFDGFGTPDSGGTIVLRCGTSTRTIKLEAATGVAVVE